MDRDAINKALEPWKDKLCARALWAGGPATSPEMVCVMGAINHAVSGSASWACMDLFGLSDRQIAELIAANNTAPDGRARYDAVMAALDRMQGIEHITDPVTIVQGHEAMVPA